MPRTFKLTKPGTYYYRRRSLPTVEVAEDGSQIVGKVECLKTRWGFQRSRYRRATDAYYHQQSGTWCRINSRVATAWDENGTHKKTPGVSHYTNAGLVKVRKD